MTDAVRITRILPASPDRVWAALTRAEALAAWFWPASFGTHIEIDKDGYRIEAKHPVMAVSGRYVEVDQPRRLVFTWRWDGDDDESRVTIELEPVGEHTELRLVHQPAGYSTPGAPVNHVGFAGLGPAAGIAAVGEVDRRSTSSADWLGHEQGWNDCLDRLLGYVTPPSLLLPGHG